MPNTLLKKADIDAMAGVEKSHYLNDEAVRINKSLGDAAGLTGFGFHLIEVPPGKWSTEFHCHHHEDECIYVLAGEAEARIGDEVVAVSAGDFIGYPAGGLAHTLKNTGTEVLRCIVVGQRLPHDVADYPDLGKRLYRNQGMAWDLVDAGQLTHPKGGKKS